MALVYGLTCVQAISNAIHNGMSSPCRLHYLYGVRMGKSYDDRISARVKVAMADRNLAQADVAEVLGIAQSQMSRRLSCDTPWKLRDLVALHCEYGMTFPLPALAGDR